MSVANDSLAPRSISATRRLEPQSFEPFRFADLRQPYAAYRALRDHAPVHYAPEAGVYCISRFDDVHSVLQDDERFSSRAMFTVLMANGNDGPPPLTPTTLAFMLRMVLRARMNPLTFATARTLIAEDGESHSQLRSIVNRGFTPRRIAAWEARARDIANGCVEKLRRGEPFDVMRDLAAPVPLTIIAEMLGVEPDRHEDFKRWSTAFVANITGPGRATPFSRPWQESMIELINYLRGIARQRRATPRDDLISAIVSEQEGRLGLSDREVVQFAILLLVAGNETTTNLIGNAVTALFDHPDVLARVAADPSLIPQVVEETLRYDGPIQMLFRTATEDVEIAGTRIPKGAVVAPLLGSANRDERRFPDPDRFDPDRDVRAHVGFGFGKHFCLGSSLARLEARIALTAIVPDLVHFERTFPSPELVESFLVRGPEKIELRAFR